MTDGYEVTVLAARDIPDSHRKHMDEADFAGKGRSFPIETPEDVHDAAQSIGRAGDDNYDTDTLKKNIIRIAKRKGEAFVARLPEEWKKDLAASEAEERPRVLILIGDSKEADGLRRIPVALITRGFKGTQKFSVTREDLASIVANFAKRGTGEVVIDYDHSTVYAAGSGAAAPAAGWLKKIDDAPDAKGVLWGWAEYTERGGRMVAAREYKYVSPVIEWSVRDKSTGEQQGATLTSLALTNSPLFEKLPALPLVASDSDGWSFDRGDVVEERRVKDVKITKVIAGAAGKVRLVADDNTETEMQLEGGQRVLTMADVKRGSDGRFDFAQLPHDENVVIASDVMRAMDVQTTIDAAVKDGKITPAQRGFYEKSAIADPEGFKALVASMKPVVALGERGTAADGVEMHTVQGIQHLIDAQIAEVQKVDPELSYGRALKLVASENPDLFREQERLRRAAMAGLDRKGGE
jgi:hypothetical protein